MKQNYCFTTQERDCSLLFFIFILFDLGGLQKCKVTKPGHCKRGHTLPFSYSLSCLVIVTRERAYAVFVNFTPPWSSVSVGPRLPLQFYSQAFRSETKSLRQMVEIHKLVECVRKRFINKYVTLSTKLIQGSSKKCYYIIVYSIKCVLDLYTVYSPP